MGLGIPPQEKFKSGHLPSGSIPVCCAAPLEEDSDFDSDMDETSDTEETYAGQHSAESSSSIPYDEISKQRLHNGVSNGHYSRYTNSVVQQHYYSSDGYSGYSSSRDTAQQSSLKPRKLVDVNRHDEEEEEWSESDESFGFNGRVERKIAANDFPLQGRYAAKFANREDGNFNSAKNVPSGVNCAFQGSHSSDNFRDVDSDSEKVSMKSYYKIIFFKV